MPDQTLPEKIANQLRRDILRGKLVPGDPLKERDKAADLGVSRTPMREAIRIIAREGLITLRSSRSPIVAMPDVKAVTDDVEVLLSVEKLSGKLACERATDADLALGLSNRGAHRFGEMAGFALGVFCGITEGARGGVG